MRIKEIIMPPIVLMLVCSVTCALLTAAYEITYVDTTGVITEKLSAGLAELYGSAEGFGIVMTEGEAFSADSIISDGNGNIAVEVTADGYSKDGLHLLIGFDVNGRVCGISTLDMRDTPGIGSRAADESYYRNFYGMSPDSDPLAVDSVTGATYSSRGVKQAVETARNAYREFTAQKEDDLHE